jgi:hypothetical protein
MSLDGHLRAFERSSESVDRVSSPLAVRQLFWVDPENKGALLVAAMRELASDDTTVAFEGNAESIESLNFPGVPDVKRNLCQPFTRQWGEVGKVYAVVVLPLTTSTLEEIVSEILPEGKFEHRIGAIQIQVGGEVQFLVGDNFHRECVSTGPLFRRDFLQNLVDRGVARGFYTTEEQRARLGFRSRP